MTFGTYWTSSILNQKTVSESQFYAEYIYNAFALNFNRTETKKGCPIFGQPAKAKCLQFYFFGKSFLKSTRTRLESLALSMSVIFPSFL